MKPVAKSSIAGSRSRKPSEDLAVRPATASLVVEADEDEDFDLVDLDENFEIPPITSVPAGVQPNPVELPAPINPEAGRKQSVEMHRNLFCLHYDNCLDEAVKRGWNSFSCVRCGFYRAARDETETGVERFATQRRAS